ncbi:hypothetical protein B0H16DRAFT_1905497 [Mycena metata]|uniref:Uncharacterized protein n=1 Tax=Mycena metata TaxID=1033252 RepID=A0AAD7GH66_9AGAR|nr:hypothetical protein B0H16DRAFT_1905497 [Mycena metata]
MTKDAKIIAHHCCHHSVSPPPPYASSGMFSMPELPEVPSTPDGGAAEDADWLNARWCEELAELLVKADGLIKERETELGVTSAICKRGTLKNKHATLVARLSPTPRHSPPLSHASLSVLEHRPRHELRLKP